MLSYLRNYWRLKTDNSGPLQLIHYLSKRCNLRCRHCFYWEELDKAEPLRMSRAELRTLISSLPKDLDLVVLAGGEPTLCDDIVEVCRYYNEIARAKSIFIDTNGYKTTSIVQTIRDILDVTTCQIHVQVSIDGPEDIHNAIRANPRSFEYAIATIRALTQIRNSRLHVRSLTVLNCDNYHYAGKMGAVIGVPGIENGYELIRGSEFSIVDPSGRLGTTQGNPKDTSLLPSPSQIDEIVRGIVREAWATAARDLPRVRIRGIYLSLLALLLDRELHDRRTPVFECLADRVLGVIYSDAEVALCEFSSPVANLRAFDLDFGKLWTSLAADERRKDIAVCNCTHGCWVIPSLVFSPSNLARLATYVGHREIKTAFRKARGVLGTGR